MGKFEDFSFFVLDPNNSSNEVAEPLPSDETPFVVAFVKLKDVDKGDKIWLNGVLRIDDENNSGGHADINVRIFRGNPSTGEEIYFSALEAENDENAASSTLQIPVSHVDVIPDENDDENVKYTLTVDTDTPNINLTGPITFTAVRIKH
ncbi:hypothetical protein JNUCC42_23350 (plasmid) [Brevibacterium sp. JNUCC-42]|nr:hypothetical protein JNUCC42_23350 [Brevibacterium sp. JNUCC-42]